MTLTNERECWLEEDAYDEHFSALCVTSDQGVDVYAPLLVGTPSGTPARHTVGVYYCEPESGLRVAIGHPELSADGDLAQALAPCVIDGFERSVDLVAEVHRQGWVVSDPDTMQVVRKLDEHTFQMLEVEGNGLYQRVASATIDLEDFSEERLEEMSAAFYAPTDGTSALEELAVANDVRCARYGEPGYPNQVLAECVFESCMAEYHGYTIESSSGVATFDDAVSLLVEVANSMGQRALDENQHRGIRY